MLTGVIPKSLPVLLTEPVLCKAAVDQGLRFSTEQYGCCQRDMILTPLQRRKRKFYHLQTLSIFRRDNVLFVCSLIESNNAEKHYKILFPSKKISFHRISLV